MPTATTDQDPTQPSATTTAYRELMPTIVPDGDPTTRDPVGTRSGGDIAHDGTAGSTNAAAIVYTGPIGHRGPVPRGAGRDVHILELLRILREFDPDASAAVSSMLTVTNSGHEIFVYDPKGARTAEGEDYINSLAKDVWRDGGGGADTLVDVLLLSFFTYGGAGIEVALNDDMRSVDDFLPFAPYDIEFVWVPVGGDKWRKAMFPARRQGNDQTLELNPIQVHYLPYQPDIDDPYGRSPLLPALSSVLGLTALLNEILHVTRIHGYGMRDLIIDHDAVVAKAPDDIKTDPNRLAGWLNDIRTGIETVVKKLKPTDTFVHYNWLTINTTVPGGRGVDLAPVIAEFSRRSFTALKTPPLLLGRLEGAQTQSTVEWAIYANSLNAMQGKAQRLVEKAYNTALRVAGIPGRVHLEFEAIRDTDRAIEAAAEAAERNNRLEEYINGIINHEDMANAISGAPARGPRPPTKADEFRLQVAQALAAIATAQSLSPGGPLAVPGTTPLDPADVPGGDAGITADEGAALDAIDSGTNIITPAQRHRAGRLALSVLGGLSRAADGDVVPDLPENAADVLGQSIVDDTRELLREIGATDLLDILDAEPTPIEDKEETPDE